jgi:alpha-tubulin suppressor-like RCC1 family protein
MRYRNRLFPYGFAAGLAVVAGCNPERILHPPASGEPAALALSYGSGNSRLAAQLAAQADAARVRVIRSDGMLVDTVFVFPATDAELHARVPVQLEGDEETVGVIVDLLENGAVLESGDARVTLRKGEVTTAAVTADLAATGALSVGSAHTCAIRNGSAWCWGANNTLAVGAGPNVSVQSTPFLIPGGPWFAISAGLAHTCALDDAGHAWCWGQNATGGLGDGTTVARANPTAVSTGETFTQIAAAGFSTCALSTAGEIWCWGGYATAPVLGNGGTGNSMVPVKASTPPGVTFQAVSSGALTSCALATTGQAYCWGSNIAGQVGDGTTTNKAVPTPVSGGHTFVSLTVANVNSFLYMACGVQPDGAALCWGFNPAVGSKHFTDTCMVANNPYSCSLVPRSVEDPPVGRYDYAAPGADHVCGVLRSGKVVCGGFNFYGQLGDGTTIGGTAPVAVSLPAGLGRLGAGLGYTCWLTRSDVYCWGNGARGQLGNGATGIVAQPYTIPGAWRDVSGIPCAAATAGAVSCWGQIIARFDTISPAPTSTPTPIGGPALRDLTGADDFACGLDSKGAAWCWGSNSYGLGDGVTTNSRSPVQVTGGRTYSAISAYRFHACAIEASTGALFCWGNNADGELGDQTTTSSAVPVATVATSGALEVAAGAYFTCGTENPGLVYCWGRGGQGQLGSPVSGSQLFPIQVPGLTGVTELVAGELHACGLMSGGVVCWGGNNSGQIGTGVSTNVEPPQLVPGVTSATLVRAGRTATCAIVGTGTVRCWGAYSFNAPLSLSPVAIAGISSATHLGVGSAAICIIHSGSTLSCMGDNSLGAVGAPLPFAKLPARVPL